MATGNTEHLKLTTNIKLASSSGLLPIGHPRSSSDADNSKEFKGTFDGQGHTISGLVVYGYDVMTSLQLFAGVFAKLGRGARVC